jgi:uncharacterized membrane protein YfcA
MFFEIFYFLCIGLFAGLLGGLFGIGGGFVFIPAQLFIYSYYDIPKELQIKFAICTSLAVVVFNTLAATYSHNKKKAINLPLFKKIVIGIILGSIFGGLLAKSFPSDLLEVIFGLMEFLFGLYFLFSPKIHDSELPKKIDTLSFNVIIFLISALSILIGVGGGIFMIPLLTFLRFPLRQSIATSALITLLVSLLGTLLLLIPSISYVSLPNTLGYLYLPAFFPLALGAIGGAPLGAHLTHSLPTKYLKKSFGILLLALSVLILIRK